jgi:hypothetical protein
MNKIQRPYYLNNNYVYLFILIAISTNIVLSGYPQLMGYWEGTTVYWPFAPTTKPFLIFGIQKAADSAGFHGIHGYAFLELARYLSDIIGHSLSNLRILPSVYGVITVFTIYMTIRKYNNPNLAFIVASLIATNILFIVFQRQLQSMSLTMMFLFLCLNRYLNWNSQKTILSAITFGLSCSLLSLNYVIGRICLVAILILSVIDIHYLFTNPSKLLNLARVKNFLYVFFSFLTFLTLFFPLNIVKLFRTDFIFTMMGENVLTTKFGFADTFIHNIKYFIQYYIIGSDSGIYPSDLILMLPYRIIHPILIPFSIYGLIISIRKKTIFNHVFLILFVLIFIAINLSSIMPNLPFEMSTTLGNPTRSYFLVPFFIYYSGLGIYELLVKLKKHRILNYILISTFCLFIVIRISMFNSESNRFKEYIENKQFDFTLPAIEKDWDHDDWTNDYIRRNIIDNSSITSDLLHKDKLELHLNQIYLYNLAKYVKSHIDMLENISSKNIIYIPENYYTPNYLRYGGASPIKGYAYYFPMYMTFYLQDKGLNISYLVRNDDIKGTLPKRAIDVLDRYNKGENNENQYPTTKEDIKKLKYVEKILGVLSEFELVNNYIQNLRRQEHYEPDAVSIGEYYVVKTSSTKPDYYLITDSKQLEQIQKYPNMEIALSLPLDSSINK